MIQNPVLLVIGFHAGDVERTKNLLTWIAELGECNPHSCLLVADSTVLKPDSDAIKKLAKKSFDTVMMIPASVECAWKPNQMFLSAAKWIHECTKLPWLWLEPDAIPLKEGWLDAIADEYAASPMAYMGPIIHQKGQPGLPEAHLTGCSVYPASAWELFASLPKLQKDIVAWDIEGAAKVIPRARNTNLIHHFWGNRDMPPIFVESKTQESPKNFVTIDFISKEAVVFHRTKDGGLINILRKARTKPSAK